MTRRERLLATMKGSPVDRPAFNFYEIGGLPMDTDDTDPFNVHNDPSWRPLIKLAEEETDLIRTRGPMGKLKADRRQESLTVQEYTENGSRFCRTTIKVGRRVLTSLDRRDPDVDTIWTVEHLLKDVDDLKAYLQLPDEFFSVDADVSNLFEAESEVGDRGIVMVDIGDPICAAAGLFDMADYTIIAFTEQELFHQLLEKLSQPIHHVARQAAAQFPGHMWRIYGPEYASEPYLPPHMFQVYVVRYTQPVVDIIHGTGGFARIHCHGRLKNILPYIAAMGADGLDPIEPPIQGDVELPYVRREYGRDMVLFGNLEVADIENMEPSEFEKQVVKALREGTSGEGRGFVLQPSASPYGRKISPRVMANYETIARVAGGWRS